jgi:hypothetical protein
MHHANRDHLVSALPRWADDELIPDLTELGSRRPTMPPERRATTAVRHAATAVAGPKAKRSTLLVEARLPRVLRAR